MTMLLILKLIILCVYLSLLCVVRINGYAELAEQMKCANEDCSEVISEGEARLTYKPRDSRFLNLRKGDVVFVKSKNAGVKQTLWGGEVIGRDEFGFFPSTFIKEVMVFHKDKDLNTKMNIELFLKKRQEVPEPADAPKEEEKQPDTESKHPPLEDNKKTSSDNLVRKKEDVLRDKPKETESVTDDKTGTEEVHSKEEKEEQMKMEDATEEEDVKADEESKQAKDQEKTTEKPDQKNENVPHEEDAPTTSNKETSNNAAGREVKDEKPDTEKEESHEDTETAEKDKEKIALSELDKILDEHVEDENLKEEEAKEDDPPTEEKKMEEKEPASDKDEDKQPPQDDEKTEENAKEETQTSSETHAADQKSNEEPSPVSNESADDLTKKDDDEKQEKTADDQKIVYGKFSKTTKDEYLESSILLKWFKRRSKNVTRAPRLQLVEEDEDDLDEEEMDPEVFMEEETDETKFDELESVLHNKLIDFRLRFKDNISDDENRKLKIEILNFVKDIQYLLEDYPFDDMDHSKALKEIVKESQGILRKFESEHGTIKIDEEDDPSVAEEHKDARKSDEEHHDATKVEEEEDEHKERSLGEKVHSEYDELVTACNAAYRQVSKMRINITDIILALKEIPGVDMDMQRSARNLKSELSNLENTILLEVDDINARKHNLRKTMDEQQAKVHRDIVNHKNTSLNTYLSEFKTLIEKVTQLQLKIDAEKEKLEDSDSTDDATPSAPQYNIIRTGDKPVVKDDTGKEMGEKAGDSKEGNGKKENSDKQEDESDKDESLSNKTGEKDEENPEKADSGSEELSETGGTEGRETELKDETTKEETAKEMQEGSQIDEKISDDEKANEKEIKDDKENKEKSSDEDQDVDANKEKPSHENEEKDSSVEGDDHDTEIDSSKDDDEEDGKAAGDEPSEKSSNEDHQSETHKEVGTQEPTEDEPAKEEVHEDKREREPSQKFNTDEDVQHVTKDDGEQESTQDKENDDKEPEASVQSDDVPSEKSSPDEDGQPETNEKERQEPTEAKDKSKDNEDMDEDNGEASKKSRTEEDLQHEKKEKKHVQKSTEEMSSEDEQQPEDAEELIEPVSDKEKNPDDNSENESADSKKEAEDTKHQTEHEPETTEGVKEDGKSRDDKQGVTKEDSTEKEDSAQTDSTKPKADNDETKDRDDKKSQDDVQNQQNSDQEQEDKKEDSEKVDEDTPSQEDEVSDEERALINKKKDEERIKKTQKYAMELKELLRSTSELETKVELLNLTTLHTFNYDHCKKNYGTIKETVLKKESQLFIVTDYFKSSEQNFETEDVEKVSKILFQLKKKLEEINKLISRKAEDEDAQNEQNSNHKHQEEEKEDTDKVGEGKFTPSQEDAVSDEERALIDKKKDEERIKKTQKYAMELKELLRSTSELETKVELLNLTTLHNFNYDHCKKNYGTIKETVLKKESQLFIVTDYFESSEQNIETDDVKKVSKILFQLKKNLEEINKLISRKAEDASKMEQAPEEEATPVIQEDLLQAKLEQYVDKLFENKTQGLQDIKAVRNPDQPVAPSTVKRPEHDSNEKCMVIPSKRVACGEIFSRTKCVDEGCCWEPVEEYGIPSCYYSLMQSALSHSQQKDQSELNEQIENDNNDESYNPLHEGEIVDWNESIEPDETKPKTVEWDESVGNEKASDDEIGEEDSHENIQHIAVPTLIKKEPAESPKSEDGNKQHPSEDERNDSVEEEKEHRDNENRGEEEKEHYEEAGEEVLDEVHKEEVVDKEDERVIPIKEAIVEGKESEASVEPPVENKIQTKHVEKDVQEAEIEEIKDVQEAGTGEPDYLENEEKDGADPETTHHEKKKPEPIHNATVTTVRRNFSELIICEVDTSTVQLSFSSNKKVECNQLSSQLQTDCSLVDD